VKPTPGRTSRGLSCRIIEFGIVAIFEPQALAALELLVEQGQDPITVVGVKMSLGHKKACRENPACDGDTVHSRKLAGRHRSNIQIT
jgi:hypothetical protein